MKIYQWKMKTGITRSVEFEKKQLAQFAVNTGLKCGHDCLYCSTGAVLRCHPAFKMLGLSPFDNGYAIVDPETPERVAYDARHMKNRGLVQLCTLTDAWSPEAQKYNLGRRCLEAILSQPGWRVRILTKNAAVAKDFDVIEKYKHRVLVGLSITAPPDRNDVIAVVEPHASSLSDRIKVLQKAHAMKLRTYAMLCPILLGVVTEREQIDEMVRVVVECGVKEIFVEPVNARGCGLIRIVEALKAMGYAFEASHIDDIRHKKQWSYYVNCLLYAVQESVRKYTKIKKLRFLLYWQRLDAQHLAYMKKHDEGVIWLGQKNKTLSSSQKA